MPLKATGAVPKLETRGGQELGEIPSAPELGYAAESKGGRGAKKCRNDFRFREWRLAGRWVSRR